MALSGPMQRLISTPLFVLAEGPLFHAASAKQDKPLAVNVQLLLESGGNNESMDRQVQEPVKIQDRSNSGKRKVSNLS